MADLFDEMLSSIGAAVADVREKYEESVWGRAVTNSGVGAPADGPEQAGFGSVTSTMEVGPAPDAFSEQLAAITESPAAPEPSQSQGIDL